MVANEVFVVFRLHQLSRNTWTRDGSLSGTFSWAKVSAATLCTKETGLCTSASNKAKSRFWSTRHLEHSFYSVSQNGDHSGRCWAEPWWRSHLPVEGNHNRVKLSMKPYEYNARRQGVRCLGSAIKFAERATLRQADHIFKCNCTKFNLVSAQ